METTYPSLPKWPQLLIRGKDISEEQALEVIRRTDTFFAVPDYSGNDRLFNKYVMGLLGIPEAYEKRSFWRQKWEYVETEFITNSWIACSSLQGPQGWCSPTGKIQFCYNVGKWPLVEDLLKDFNILIKAFPFLEFAAVAMSGEYEDERRQPVISFKVALGDVQILPASLEVLDPYGGPITPPPSLSFFTEVVFKPASERERGLSMEILKLYEQKAISLGLK